MAAKICCPIEMEPKTLSEGQLNHARELAADVVLKLEPEELSTIFTKKATTLVPSQEAMEPNIAADTVDEMRKKDEAIGDDGPGAVVCECCCIDPTNSVGGGVTLDELKLKEPLTAPF